MRKAIDDLITAVSSVHERSTKGEHVAILYSNMSDIEQAVFWHHVAEHFSAFPKGGGCIQNCEAVSLMTKKAKDYIKNLYDHIKLSEGSGSGGGYGAGGSGAGGAGGGAGGGGGGGAKPRRIFK
jgi:uncharacterized membrane protein YgcG